MFNFLLTISNLLVNKTTNGGEKDSAVVDPIYNALDIILPVALGIVLLSGTLYAVVIGVQYSKAEDSDTRGKAKKKLIDGIIGFGIVIVLSAILYAIRGSIVDLINS